MANLTTMQAISKTAIVTKKYIDDSVTIIDTDLQQVIYDVYGFTLEETPTINYSESTQAISVEENFVSYDEPTKTLNIKGLEL